MYNIISRKKYLHTNTFQRRILWLAIVPSLIFCIFITISILELYREMDDFMKYFSKPAVFSMIEKWGLLIISALWLLFVFIIVWVFNVSGKLVGAFGRIIRELDEFIDGKEIKRIKARRKDDLANELLKRINILIKNLPHDWRSKD